MSTQLPTAFAGRSFLVTRHPGAIEWARRRGIAWDAHLSHVDPECIAPGDRVIGNLPVHLAALVCARGAQYWHLAVDVAPVMRGRELDFEDLERMNARLEAYEVKKLSPRLETSGA